MSEYAIIEHGGKQYRVAPGDELLVERTEAGLGRGDGFLFERVMLLSRDGELSLGAPVVDGALVRARVVAAERGDKVRIFKKKKRKGYRRTNGHRQDYYRVRVESIEA